MASRGCHEFGGSSESLLSWQSACRSGAPADASAHSPQRERSVNCTYTHFMSRGANRPPRSAELFEQIQGELRRLAAAAMKQERGEHTLQPTALMNELWIRLQAGGSEIPVEKGPFLGLAAKVMRQVLVDHARARNRLKRSGGWRPVTIAMAADVAMEEGEEEIDVVDLDLALADLREVSERQAEVVELRFFAGLEVEDVAAALDVSPRTVAREWRFAKAWLVNRMGELG